jgi:hypothetical protein
MPKVANNYKLKQKTDRHSPVSCAKAPDKEPVVFKRRNLRSLSKKSFSHKGGRKPRSAGKAACEPSSSSTTTTAAHANSSDDDLVEDSFASAQMMMGDLAQQQRAFDELNYWSPIAGCHELCKLTPCKNCPEYYSGLNLRKCPIFMCSNVRKCPICGYPNPNFAPEQLRTCPVCEDQVIDDETKLKRVETAFVNEIVHIFVEKAMVRILYELFNAVLGECTNYGCHKTVTVAMQLVGTCLTHTYGGPYGDCGPAGKHEFFSCCNTHPLCSD